MRKIFLLLSLGLVALTGCKKDSSSLEESLIANLIMPEGPFAPGASVTIQGKGFTAADEIWFRTPTKAADDIQAEVTNQADNELTFTVPQVAAGEHAVILKRGTQKMPLGKLTVSEAAATKLYAFGGDEDLDNFDVLWEIDKATGELTEIVKLPIEVSESVEELWEDYPVVNPADGNIYLCKKIGTKNSGQWSDQLDLYCVNPNNKILNKIGLLDKEAEHTYYYLCIIDGRLHALIEKESGEEDSRETFCSLVSINPETAEQTLVADFGSLYQALDIPGDVPARIDVTAIYDKTTNSLIVPIYKDVETDAWQLARFDITNKKIIPGEKFNEYDWISIFPKDGTICGAFETNAANSVDFRTINTENLTVGESLGSATSKSGFGETWVYDTATGKGYTTMYFEDSSDAYRDFGAFDFNTKKFDKIKVYAPEIWFDLF